MLPALVLLVSLALRVPRRPVLHRSAALAVCLLYGKRLTKLCRTRQLGPGPGADAFVCGGCRTQPRPSICLGAAPWEPCALPSWRALVLDWHRAASLEGAGVISSHCEPSCGRTDSRERCRESAPWLP